MHTRQFNHEVHVLQNSRNYFSALNIHVALTSYKLIADPMKKCI